MIKKIFKHKVSLFSLVFVVVIAIALVIVYRQLNSSVSVALNSSSSSGSSSQYDINLTPTPISDKYISFNYPKGLKLKSTALAGSSSIDDYTFSAKDIYTWSLDIDVSTVPGGSITQSSSYKYRQENPSEYSLTNKIINSMPVAIMTDDTFTGGFSKVAYISSGSNVATISLIGEDSSGDAPLTTTFNMVLNSWKWHIS